MGSRIQKYIKDILVSWLDERLLRAFNQQADFFVDDSVTARTQGFLETQDGPMLDYTARNSGDRRLLYRFPTPESDTEFRSYLRTRWARHEEAGALDALDAQTRRYGFTRYTWVNELMLREAGYATPFGQPANGLVNGPPYSPVLTRDSGQTAPDGSVIPTYQMWPRNGDPLPFGGGTAAGDCEPGPGTGFFAVILHPPHYFQPPAVWDGGELWDGGSWWDFGAVYGYPGVSASTILADYAALIADYRAAGSSLRHIVVDFVGDCVVDNTTPTGYAGTNFTIFPVWEQAERISGGYASFYNYGWRFA
jgi:hypothetical protein